jgi:hypothetical protein
MSEYLDGGNDRKSALGMIMQDINEYGFETWLEMPAESVVSCYLDITEELMDELVVDFKTMLAQEDELASLGLEQSMRIDAGESLEAFKDGTIDILRSLLLYIQTQRQAQALYIHEG